MKTGYWTDKFSYVTGALRSKELACLAIVADERASKKDDHSIFLQWKSGKWGRLLEKAVAWTTVDATVCRHPQEQTLFLGLAGEVFCVGGGDAHQEVIRSGAEDSPEKRGMMRGIKSIQGVAYAVGMQRQVYRRDGARQWSAMDRGARPTDDDDNVYSFEAIDGFTESDIYAVGRRGEIWHYDRDVWSKQDSPTNMILTRVCCADDAKVYACGRVGTLVCGRGAQWEQIDHGATKEDFWGLAWYKDHLYLSTMRRIFMLDGDNKLSLVNFTGDRPSSCFALTVADGIMWSIGSKDVFAFDGEAWVRID